MENVIYDFRVNFVLLLGRLIGINALLFFLSFLMNIQWFILCINIFYFLYLLLTRHVVWIKLDAQDNSITIKSWYILSGQSIKVYPLMQVDYSFKSEAGAKGTTRTILRLYYRNNCIAKVDADLGGWSEKKLIQVYHTLMQLKLDNTQKKGKGLESPID